MNRQARGGAAIALGVAFALSGHAALADFHDCTEQAPEPVVHHVKRVLHNLLHPRHRLPPAPQLCGEPNLIVVTVEAPRVTDLVADPGQAGLAGLPGGPGSGSDAYYFTGTYYLPLRGPALEPKPPMVLPAPPGLWVLLAGTIAALSVRGRRRRE